MYHFEILNALCLKIRVIVAQIPTCVNIYKIIIILGDKGESCDIRGFITMTTAKLKGKNSKHL